MLTNKHDSYRYEMEAIKGKLETDIFSLSKFVEELKEQKGQLERNLNDQTSKRIKTETHCEDNKSSYDIQSRTMTSSIDKLNFDINNLQSRLNTTTEHYNECYRDNEKILRE